MLLATVELETACPIENFNRLSLQKRSRKRLVPPKIQCFQRFPATLSLQNRPIRRQVLGKISDHIPSHLHGGGAPRRAGGGGGVDAGGVVHKIGVKACCADLLVSQVPGQLMDDSADHLQMPQLVRPIRLSAEAAPAGAGTASVSIYGRG